MRESEVRQEKTRDNANSTHRSIDQQWAMQILDFAEVQTHRIVCVGTTWRKSSQRQMIRPFRINVVVSVRAAIELIIAGFHR